MKEQIIEPKYLRVVSQDVIDKVLLFLEHQGWDSDYSSLSIDQKDYLKDVIMATFKLLQEK